MLNNLDPLANLKDIHLPQPIQAWPWAMGWYGLIILGVVGFLWAAHLLFKRIKKNKPKKLALQLLTHLQKIYMQDNNAAYTASEISALLKRIAFVYYPRQELAKMQGEAWVDFLTTHSQNLDFKKVAYLLTVVPFKAHPKDDLSPLFEMARLWIKQRRYHV